MKIKKKGRPILVEIPLKGNRRGIVQVKVKQVGATRKKSVLGAILHSTNCAAKETEVKFTKKRSKGTVQEPQKERTCTEPIIPPPGNILEIGEIEEQPTTCGIKTPSKTNLKMANKHGKKR